MSRIPLTQELKQKLHALGVDVMRNVGSYPENLVLEPPCSLKRLVADNFLTLGAFSYMVSGYVFSTEIGRYVSIGEEVQIGRHSHPLDFGSTSPIFYTNIQNVLGTVKSSSIENALFKRSRPPTKLKKTIINNDVYIGHGAFIMPGVRVGNGAVIGAYSVVTKDVPDYAIVAGCPAKIIRYRFSSEMIDKLLESAWWDFSPEQLKGIDASNPSEFIQRVKELKENKIKPYSPKKIKISDL